MDQTDKTTNSENFGEEECFWNFDRIIEALRLVSVPVNIPVSGFSIDSRTLNPGEVFVALKGTQAHGHDFLEQAFEKGAVLAIVEDINLPALKNRSFLCVPQTLQALKDLAAYAREKTSATLVGISGSVGKTTIRSWIYQILSPFGDTTFSPKSYNNQIGLPLSLMTLTPETKFGVFEIGISSPHTMKELATLCRPHVAVISPVCHAHCEAFASQEELVHEKALLLSGLAPRGIAVIEQETCKCFPVFQNIAKENGVKEIITVGWEEGARARILETKESGRGRTQVFVDMAGNIFEYTISMRGEHFVLDSVLALTAALCAAFDDDSLEDIVVRHNEKIRTLFLPLFEFLQVLEGRGRISSLFIRNLQILLVDDSYNANLNSMSAGLRSFLKQKASRHIAVVGDMLELGPYAQEDHETLFKTFANSCLSKVFAVGRACEEPWKSLPQHQKGGWSETAQDLWPLIERELQSGDAVWVKGSHSMNLDWIVQQMKKEAQLDKKTHKAA